MNALRVTSASRLCKRIFLELLYALIVQYRPGHLIPARRLHIAVSKAAILASESNSSDSNFGVTSMAEDAPSQVDPAMPHEKTEGKVGPIDPSSTKGLARLPTDVKSTMTKADELILRLGKYASHSPP